MVSRFERDLWMFSFIATIILVILAFFMSDEKKPKPQEYRVVCIEQACLLELFISQDADWNNTILVASERDVLEVGWYVHTGMGNRILHPLKDWRYSEGHLRDERGIPIPNRNIRQVGLVHERNRSVILKLAPVERFE